MEITYLLTLKSFLWPQNSQNFTKFCQSVVYNQYLPDSLQNQHQGAHQGRHERPHGPLQFYDLGRYQVNRFKGLIWSDFHKNQRINSL